MFSSKLSITRVFGFSPDELELGVVVVKVVVVVVVEVVVEVVEVVEVVDVVVEVVVVISRAVIEDDCCGCVNDIVSLAK